MRAIEECIVFYQEIGIAVTQWAQLEMSLFQFLVMCFPRDQEQLVYAGFSSLEGFRAKLNFVSNVLHEKVTKEQHVKDWDAAVGRLSKLSTSRNKLAHWRALTIAGNPVGRRYCLIPWKQSKAQQHSVNPKGALYVRDINSIRFQFFAANIALVNLRCRLMNVKEAAEKHVETPMSPLTLKQLAASLRQVIEPESK